MSGRRLGTARTYSSGKSSADPSSSRPAEGPAKTPPNARVAARAFTADPLRRGAVWRLDRLGEHAEPDWLRRQFAALDLCVRDFVCAHARGATEPTTFNTKEDIVGGDGGRGV